MLFVVQFEDIYADQPERLPERQQHMPAHLAFLAQHPDKVVAAGALRESQEGTPLEGFLVAWLRRLHEFLWRQLIKPSKKGRPCRKLLRRL